MKIDWDAYKARFIAPRDTIYLLGNSLGLYSPEAEAGLLKAISHWREHGINGFMAEGAEWFAWAERIGELLAPLVGASAQECVPANSTTVNLHQLLATLYEPIGDKKRILIDRSAFPSDSYAVQSFLAVRGCPEALKVVEPAGRLLDADQIVEALTEEVALVLLPAVVYTTGQLLPVERIARACQDRGATFLLDCSHSIGAVPHRLHDWGVDGAFWCSYKYLNAGPGSPGGLFLHSKHFGRRPGLAGWFGSDKSRQMEMTFEMIPAMGAGAMQIGSPPVLAFGALEASLKMIDEVGIENIRARSLELTERMIALCPLPIATPRLADQRGGHVSIVHPQAAGIQEELQKRGVMTDFRNPDIVRMAPNPMYNSMDEVERAMTILAGIV
ncbi:MAG: kynureninase [Armatimonadetes bacterium]|nr:kynureninase [Armatimonadota bacterium]